jgi:hypothetical protein
MSKFSESDESVSHIEYSRPIEEYLGDQGFPLQSRPNREEDIKPEKLMRRTIYVSAAVLVVVMAATVRNSERMHAQTHEHMTSQGGQTTYPNMASIDLYLMDREAEIALARSAAPEAISRDATVLVLGRHGYETAATGNNGFVCLVERAWMSPFKSPDFWHPKIRGPLCLNPPAVRSILPMDYKKTELALAGRSKEQIMDWTKTAYAKKELPALEPGAMSYMMSKTASLTGDGGNLAHLMFYTPFMEGAEWGAGLPKSPVILGDQGPPGSYDLFVIPVGKWSDGTSAPLPR